MVVFTSQISLVQRRICVFINLAESVVEILIFLIYALFFIEFYNHLTNSIYFPFKLHSYKFAELLSNICLCLTLRIFQKFNFEGVFICSSIICSTNFLLRHFCCCFTVFRIDGKSLFIFFSLVNQNYFPYN